MPGRRRYRIADTPSGLPFRRPERPGMTIVALAAVVVVAALIGVFLGTETIGGSSTSTGSSRAGAGSAPSTVELNRELGGVLGQLANARREGSARQASAAGAAQQATAIVTIASAYATATRQVAAIPGTPAALRNVLAELASDYRSLAAAARAGDASLYKRLATRIDSQEQRLRSLAASL